MKCFGSILTTMTWTSVALLCVGTVSRAGDIAYGSLDHGVVDGLAMMQDLEPLDESRVSRLAPGKSASSAFRIEARSSTPDVDRSKSYTSADPFAGTRTVLPLLVADLSPQGTLARPMTGRSVGARPSLPLARPESR